jgi:hypothetical protein
MGKIVIWIIVVFAVLMGLRLLNTGKAKRRRAGGAGDSRSAPQAMVRCVRCGVFLPQAEAKPGPNGMTCADPKCSTPN